MSLRLRLLIAVGLISITALVVADVATYSALRSYLYSQVDETLVAHRLPVGVNQLTGGLECAGPGNSGFIFGGPERDQPGQTTGAPNALVLAFVEIRSANGRVINGIQCPSYIQGRAYSPQLSSHITGLSPQADGSQATYFTTAASQAGGPPFRVRVSNGVGTLQLPNGDQLVVAVPISDQTSTLHTLYVTELAVTAAAVFIILLGGWWLIRVSLRPLADVEKTAEEIAVGQLDQRVPGAENGTEVGRLIRTFNMMLERIQSSFLAKEASQAQLKTFVSDASHELRTPIAAVSAYAQLFDRAVKTNSEDIPRIVSGIQTETRRMEGLVNDLLALARLDEGVQLDKRQVELVALCAERINVSKALDADWKIEIKANRPVEVYADPDRLSQVLDNLLGNIRSHTPRGTAATVTVEEDRAYARIVVSDDGPGMTQDQADHIFERFYRLDPSRTHAQGGAGLGLSIVAAIVQAHGGSISANSQLGHGLVVIILIPTSEKS